MSDHADDSARPAKRARLDDNAAPSPSSAPAPQAATIAPQAAIDTDLEREVRAGITEYVCPDNLGFTGVLKQRYTDFLVNEIGLDGQVLHLKSTDVPKKERRDKPNGTGANSSELGERKNGGGVKLVVEEENGDATMVDAHDGEQKIPVKTEDAPVQDETVIVPGVEQEAEVKQEEEKPETEVEVNFTAHLAWILLTTHSLLTKIATHYTTFSARIPPMR
jgi:tRNA pseudouridine13 synthase